MRRRSTLFLASAGSAVALGLLATAGCAAAETTPAAYSRPQLPPASAASYTKACPVDVRTLTAALARNPKIESELAQPASLLTPTCYNGYATASTAPKPGLDAPVILFHYDATARQWVAENVGSSDLCTGYVPDDIAAHLPQCG